MHGPDLVRTRRDAEQRGLVDRVVFLERPSAEVPDGGDLLINLGAYQAFGSCDQALTQLVLRLRPGGRVLFGCEVWQSPPTTEELAVMWEGATAGDCLDLPDLIDLVHGAGWRVLDLHESTVPSSTPSRSGTCRSGRSGCSVTRATRSSRTWTRSGPPGRGVAADPWAS